MKIDVRFERALGVSDRVVGLRQLAQQLLNEGADRAAILDRFEKTRQQLRAAGREEEEDAVMDVMDMLNGWCSPHMKL